MSCAKDQHTNGRLDVPAVGRAVGIPRRAGANWISFSTGADRVRHFLASMSLEVPNLVFFLLHETSRPVRRARKRCAIDCYHTAVRRRPRHAMRDIEESAGGARRSARRSSPRRRALQPEPGSAGRARPGIVGRPRPHRHRMAQRTGQVGWFSPDREDSRPRRGLKEWVSKPPAPCWGNAARPQDRWNIDFGLALEPPAAARSSHIAAASR